MSLKGLVIPEDPTYNGYILKPLVERMLAELGKANARVMTLTNPKLGGYEQAVRALQRELPSRYGHFELWLFLPDADHAGYLETLEDALAQQRITLLCCGAVPEVEAWLLAGHRERLKVKWAEARIPDGCSPVCVDANVAKRGRCSAAPSAFAPKVRRDRPGSPPSLEPRRT